MGADSEEPTGVVTTMLASGERIREVCKGADDAPSIREPVHESG
jgi:hypothetical protein